MLDEMRTMTKKGYNRAQNLINILELFTTDSLEERYQLQLIKTDLKFFEAITNLLDDNPDYDYIPKSAFRRMLAGKMHAASYMSYQAKTNKSLNIAKDIEAEASYWTSYYKTLWTMYDFGPFFDDYDLGRGKGK